MTHPTKMLIADDDPFAVDSLELEDIGSTTVSASNGREALKRVAVEAPDLISTRIHEAGGDINEATGDGFMAIFQAADVQAHPVMAVHDGTTSVQVCVIRPGTRTWQGSSSPAGHAQRLVLVLAGLRSCLRLLLSVSSIIMHVS